MMPTGMTVMLAVEPVHMGLSFDGLASLVTARFGSDPNTERMLFVFVNRQRTTLKVLWRDGLGWFILARRLDRHVLELPRNIPSGARSVQVDTATLARLLEGVERVRRETRKDVARAARAAAKNQ